MLQDIGNCYYNAVKKNKKDWGMISCCFGHQKKYMKKESKLFFSNPNMVYTEREPVDILNIIFTLLVHL